MFKTTFMLSLRKLGVWDYCKVFSALFCYLFPGLLSSWWKQVKKKLRKKLKRRNISVELCLAHGLDLCMISDKHRKLLSFQLGFLFNLVSWPRSLCMWKELWVPQSLCSSSADTLPWRTGRIPLSSLERLPEQYQLNMLFSPGKVMGEDTVSDICPVSAS